MLNVPEKLSDELHFRPGLLTLPVPGRVEEEKGTLIIRGILEVTAHIIYYGKTVVSI